MSDASQDHGNKYESLLEEFEELKRQKVVSSNNTTKNEMSNSFKNSNENSNECTQLQRIKTHNKNLEERIRLLNEEIAKREQEFKVKLENQHKVIILLFKIQKL